MSEVPLYHARYSLKFFWTGMEALQRSQAAPRHSPVSADSAGEFGASTEGSTEEFGATRDAPPGGECRPSIVPADFAIALRSFSSRSSVED